MIWVKKGRYWWESDEGYRVSVSGPVFDRVYSAWCCDARPAVCIGMFRDGTDIDNAAAAKAACDKHYKGASHG